MPATRLCLHRTVLSALALAVCSLAPAAVAQSVPAAQRMIQLERDANTRCRGGSGDQQVTWEACGERTAYGRVLGMMGWCYGRQGEAGYQMQWHRCIATSIRPE